MTFGRKLKKWWRGQPGGRRQSLREFARRLANNGFDGEGQQVAQSWLAAKRAAIAKAKGQS